MRTWCCAFLFAACVAIAGIAADQPPAPVAGETKDTIINAKNLLAQNNGAEAYFVFSGDVVVTGTNLVMTCDKLEVWAAQGMEGNSTLARVGKIRRALATGKPVVVTQEARKGTAGQVEVLPFDDVIILTGDPVVTDPTGTLYGEKMTYRRGKQEVEIEGPRAVLPRLPDFGLPRPPAQQSGATNEPPSTPPAPAPGGN